ncbi:MAG: TetR family transcriptional regulator [Hydrogenophaga sp.]|jgi:TetR/AcrR family acrAB operon transcriptional repressor|nr:TetR family transcriptional regulator [Hydrogenophaga sp.]
MVRRTKAEALATRNALLDAAEQLFQARGVSRTSLNDIAVAAGTTRGAIYWHFKDKADLFNAMMERVTLPMEDTLFCGAQRAASLPAADDTTVALHTLRQAILDALEKTATDPQVRRVFEVATHKVEYVEEMQAVRERHLQVRNTCVAVNALALRQASHAQEKRLPVPLQTAALGLHVIVDGLIQSWLLDTRAFDLVASGRQIIDTYLAGLGIRMNDAPAPRRRAPAPETAA